MYTVALINPESKALIDSGHLLRYNIYLRTNIKSVNREVCEVECLVFTYDAVKTSMFEEDFVKILQSYKMFNEDLGLVFIREDDTQGSLLVSYLEGVSNTQVHTLPSYDTDTFINVSQGFEGSLVTPLVDEDPTSPQGTSKDIDYEFLNRLNYSLQISSNPQTLIRFVENNTAKFKTLIQNYPKLLERLETLEGKNINEILTNENLKFVNDMLEDTNKGLEEALDRSVGSYNTVANHYKTLQGAYNELLDQISLAKRSQLQFYNTPVVSKVDKVKAVYFKEYTYVKYFRTFLETLSEHLHHNKVPHKILIIDNGRARLPFWEERFKSKGTYSVIAPDYSLSKLSSSEVTAVFHNPHFLIEEFYNRNDISTELLLIYDVTGGANVLVEPCLRFNLIHDLEICSYFNINPLISISNNADNPIGLKEIEGFGLLKEVGLVRQDMSYNPTFGEIYSTIMTYLNNGGS